MDSGQNGDPTHQRYDFHTDPGQVGQLRTLDRRSREAALWIIFFDGPVRLISHKPDGAVFDALRGDLTKR
jgi:hypothetical protein